jgi:hypothetical protein
LPAGDCRPRRGPPRQIRPKDGSRPVIAAAPRDRRRFHAALAVGGEAQSRPVRLRVRSGVHEDVGCPPASRRPPEVPTVISRVPWATRARSTGETSSSTAIRRSSSKGPVRASTSARERRPRTRVRHRLPGEVVAHRSYYRAKAEQPRVRSGSTRITVCRRNREAL